MMNLDANAKIKYSPYSIQENVEAGGILSKERCVAAARAMFQMYDTNNDGYLDISDCQCMIEDIYRLLNRNYTPSDKELDDYKKVFTTKDGAPRISQMDAEKLCIRYFSGDGVSSVKQTAVQSPKEDFTKISSSNVENKSFTKKTITTTTITTTTKVNKKLDEKLDAIRRIFKKIDSDGTGYLTEDEVPQLLKESYKQMGMDFDPSEEDVKAWMEMADRDSDGKVTLEDYEILVKKSFEHQGMNYQ